MHIKSLLARLAPLALGTLVAACGASGRASDEVDAGTDRDPQDPDVCDEGDTRVCVGLEVHACNADGSTGGLLETCGGSCSRGTCTSDCDAEGVDKIYVVGDDYRLHAFDPARLPASGSADAAFSPIGQLSCPAGPAINGIGGTATPFSMSVARDGTAWVLYSSGEIFHVSIADASCSATDFAVGQSGFDLFGMGFVSDANGSENETLYIAGGDAAQTGPYTLGTVDGAMTVSPIGQVTSSGVGPELTGTGAGELWGYFPGDLFGETKVARIAKETGTAEAGVPLPPLDGSPRAWAFAQHGGKFYVFITYSDFLTLADVPAVQVVDPATGDVQVYQTSNIIVGAGVSTCAPAGPVE